jgi:hypothetical protein
LQEDTELLGEIDALTVRKNILQEAESLEERADLTRTQGDMAAKAGNRAFNTSLLSAAGTAVAAGFFTPQSAAVTSSSPLAGAGFEGTFSATGPTLGPTQTTFFGP